MPKESTGSHTAESVEHVAARLEQIVAQIRGSKGVMEITPPLANVAVTRETSLQNGLTGMQSWADALRDAVHSARLDMLRGNGVSDPPPGTDKRRKKK